MSKILAFTTAQADKIVADWTRAHIAHGGAIDVRDIADSDFDAEGMMAAALTDGARFSSEAECFVEVFGEHGCEDLLAAFQRFIDGCVAQADAIEA